LLVERPSLSRAFYICSSETKSQEPILESPGEAVKSYADIALLGLDGECRLTAEVDGQAVGIGALVAKNWELRACYVHPLAGLKGVGSALVLELERIAIELGLLSLSLDSSLTAEGFYRSHGYKPQGCDEHMLSGGVPMACVKMHKDLLSLETITVSVTFSSNWREIFSAMWRIQGARRKGEYPHWSVLGEARSPICRRNQHSADACRTIFATKAAFPLV
jgi:GNAT superfamily N-acetyltransferase